MTFDKQSIIKSFLLEQELDDFVVNLLYEEFLKPGLILLPSGNTFEKSIYPRLDALFATVEFQTFSAPAQDTKSREIKKQINPDLKVSHLDELIADSDSAPIESFAKAIKSSLPNITAQLKDKFYDINTQDIDAFNKYLRLNRPRLIFAGLGLDPQNAHFAFIGEDFLNSEVSKIQLSSSAQASHRCKEAITIGTDVLKYTSLEKIYVVVKGKEKAASLKAAFEDDTTGLGYVIANHSDKLCIITDNEASSELL